jgi:O-antigen/teichoic acid export membrane protein
MGIIQRQSIRSSIYILVGFAIGAINILILFPLFFSQAEIGMTRAMMDISLTLSTLATLGTLPVIYKFYPFYKDYLDKDKNDLPFISAVVCLFGFVLVLIGGFLFQDLIIRKLGKSAEFSNYFYLVYPYSFLLLLFLWLEAFAWGLKKTTQSNFAKETLLRFIVTILIILYAAGLLNIKSFMNLYSLLFLAPALLILVILAQSGQWKFNMIRPSRVSFRLSKRMINFGLFVFGAQFLNVFARTSDTIFAIGFEGLPQAGLFAIGSYLIAVMEIPQRSLNTISIPVLAESWKNRDMVNIAGIYKKSVSNLLIIGTGLFCLVLLNIADLVKALNYFGRKSGADYSIIIQIVLFMGLARVVDLGTGINAQIIGTSKFWKFDFFTNVLYTLLSIPLNFILIKKYGIVGLAYANLISLTTYNIIRYAFLWIKFDMQPYTRKSLFTVLLAAICFTITWFIPLNMIWYFSIIIRSVIFCFLFVPSVYFGNLSPEFSSLAGNFIRKITEKSRL